MLFVPSFLFLLSICAWFFKPEIVQYIFLANLWLLSYPHTFATYSRSYFSNPKNKIKAFFVIVLFLIFNIGVVYFYDFVLLINIYFYSQFFHYMRQNFGISKLKSKMWNKYDSILFHLFYIFSLIFFWRIGHTFLGYKVFSPTLPSVLVTICGISGAFVFMYFIFRYRSISKYTFIYLSLTAVMTINLKTFILGWLGLHLFHNSQYLVMSWQLNPKRSFLKFYSILVISVAVIYSGAIFFDQYFSAFVSLSFCLILSVNYSHYLFDSFLWKRRYRSLFP